MTLLNDAIEYAELGLSVVPVRRQEKFPHVKWTEFQNRRATEEELEAWWEQWPDANVGFITGAISNVVVIDADTPERVKWLRENFPTSVFQATGRDSGGLHGFYRPNGQPVKTIAGLLPGVDIKGDGGFSVLAPSVHRSGRLYALEYTPGFDSWDDLADFPYNIFPAEKQLEIKPPVTRGVVVQGARNETLTRLAGRYCKMGHDYDQVVMLCSHDNATYSPPLPACDVERICKSIHGRDHKSDTDCEVMTATDVEKQGLSLNIPDNLICPGGLIDLGVEGMLDAGIQDIPQFYMPVILSHIANAIAGKIVFSGIWPLFYNVKIAGSSTGKSRSDKILKSIIEKRSDFENFYGPNKPASGPGILTGLQGNPQQLMILDEMQSLFKRYGINDPIGDGKREALLELYSEAGSVIKKTYGSTKNSFEILQPCLNILGNTTLGIFDSIKTDDFASGLIPRVDFWCFDGKVEAMKFVGATSNPKLDSFCDGLAHLYNVGTGDTPQGDLSFLGPTDIFKDNGCSQILDDILTEKADYANDNNNQEENKALVNRKLEIAIRYGMVHHAAKSIDMRSPMVPDSLIYGRAMADMLVDWKINTLGSKVTSSELQRKCEVFKKAILSSIRAEREKPTFKFLINRSRELKGWSKKEAQEVIEMLETRKEIALDEEKKSTRYSLVKEKKDSSEQ